MTLKQLIFQDLPLGDYIILYICHVDILFVSNIINIQVDSYKMGLLSIYCSWVINPIYEYLYRQDTVMVISSST